MNYSQCVKYNSTANYIKFRFHFQEKCNITQERKRQKSTAVTESEGGVSEDKRRQRLLLFKDICVLCNEPAVPHPRHPGFYGPYF